MKIEIVTHCWNYPRLLMYHLSSLVKHPPKKCTVQMTIFNTENDIPTQRVLNYFGKMVIPNVSWKWWSLPPDQITMRAIGRNKAALQTKSDWLWFCDADYWIGEGALDSLAEQVNNLKEILVYPRFVRGSRSHETGDAAIERASGEPRVLDIDPEEYVEMKNRKAIGGLQIAKGSVCKEKGYCKDSRRAQTPRNSWRRTLEDKAFRSILGTSGKGLLIPNIYRIRHGKRGGIDDGVYL